MNASPLDQQRFDRYDTSTSTFVLAIVTDEDQAAQVELDDGQIAWQSTVRYDRLYRREALDTGQISYDVVQVPPEEGGLNRLISLVAEGGRGAEFSERALYGERLLAFDGRTGMVCEIREGHQLIPRQILMTGSGGERFKGFKGEWATVKGDRLIVGSHGKNREESGSRGSIPPIGSRAGTGKCAIAECCKPWASIPNVATRRTKPPNGIPMTSCGTSSRA